MTMPCDHDWASLLDDGAPMGWCRKCGALSRGDLRDPTIILPQCRVRTADGAKGTSDDPSQLH